MKLVSTLALGAALALGVIGVPAVAKDKKEVPAAKTQQLSADFRKAAVPVQEAIKLQAFADAQTKLAAVDAVSKSPDELFIAAQFRYQIANALKDDAGRSKAIDAMIASGGAPAEMQGQLTLASGQAAYQAGNYPLALERLKAAQAAGNKNPDLLLLLAETNFKTNQIPAGLAYVEQAIAASTAAGTKPPASWYARAASVAYKANMMGEASKWTRAQVKQYPTAENWRSALIIYRDSTKLDNGIALDLYRLMRATKSLDGERDYFEYANLAFERGLPGETKSVIDEGTASGKFPAGSRSLTELKTMSAAKIAGDRTSLPASEKQAATSATGRIAANTADAYLGYGDYAKAVALYRVALQKGGVDADAVNTRIGIALTQSGDKEGARAAFASVKGARTEIAQFWTLWLDQQSA